MAIINSIKRARPHHKDKYFVDTNVWFWFTYCASKEIETENEPARYQLNSYPEFIEKVLDEGAKLFHCPLVFSELANIIERTEFEIYKMNNPNVIRNKKDFRANSAERAKVLRETKMAWDLIGSLSTCLEFSLDEQVVIKIQDVLSISTLDPYDAFYYQLMSSEGITKIITDDKDFNSTDIGNIYTANNAMLRS